MKYKAIIFSLLLSHCALWGQTGNHTIKISNDIDLIRLSSNAYIHVSRAAMGSFGMVSSNGLIFIDKGKAFLFDSPVDEAQTKTLITWVRKKLTGCIRRFRSEPLARRLHGRAILYQIPTDSILRQPDDHRSCKEKPSIIPG